MTVVSGRTKTAQVGILPADMLAHMLLRVLELDMVLRICRAIQRVCSVDVPGCRQAVMKEIGMKKKVIPRRTSLGEARTGITRRDPTADPEHFRAGKRKERYRQTIDLITNTQVFTQSRRPTSGLRVLMDIVYNHFG